MAEETRQTKKGKLIGADCGHCQARFLDSGKGDTQVFIFRQGRADEELQLFVLEQLPPVQVGNGFAGLCRRAVASGYVQRRTLIIRCQGAGYDQRQDHCQQR